MKINLTCAFGLHDFTKWEIYEEGKMQKPAIITGESVTIGDYKKMERKCNCCGITQIKRIET